MNIPDTTNDFNIVPNSAAGRKNTISQSNKKFGARTIAMLISFIILYWITKD